MPMSYPESWELVLHLVSILLAGGAIVWTSRLTFVSRRTGVWLLLSIAFAILAGERIAGLFYPEVSRVRDSGTELLDDLLHLVISGLLLAGIYHLRLVFLERQEEQRKLSKQYDELQRLYNILLSRELRLKELFEENRSLKSLLSKHPELFALPDMQRDIAVTPSPPAMKRKADSIQIPEWMDVPQADGNIVQERTALLFLLEDIERIRHQIEQAHREWTDALDAVHDPVFMHDQAYRILRCNRAYAERAGMRVKEVIGKVYWEVFPKLPGPQLGCCKSMQDAEEQKELMIEGGEIFLSRSFAVRNSEGMYLYSLHIMEDITERKRAEATIAQSERRYHSLFDNMLEGFAYCKMEFVSGKATDFIYLDVNMAFERLSGLKDVVGKRVSEVIPGIQQTNPELFEIYGQVALSGEPARFETYIERLETWFYLSVYSMEKGYFVAVFDNITERKRTDLDLRKLNRALIILSRCNEILVHASEENALLKEMCDIIVETGGYLLTWVGYAERDEQKSVRPVASAGDDEHYLAQARISWGDVERGHGPVGMAIRTQTAQLTRDTLTDPAYRPWLDSGIKLGFRSILALPLASVGQTMGALAIYSPEADGFSDEEIRLLSELADDLAFGIVTLRVRSLQVRTAERLQASLEGTIVAMAAVVEMRDPYTAGHQRRVAALAGAIAREIGLSEDEVHGIHLAAMIHDLGKIQIPSEILTKPTKLTALEHEMIKVHPAAGYDILKGIDFPWPIAEIVYQHHERIDGSGYPRGLKNNQISMGARILAVADTVEAMSSHRPYRPGFGIEAALEEIVQFRGTHYDPITVDICVKLFSEKRFMFSE